MKVTINLDEIKRELEDKEGLVETKVTEETAYGGTVRLKISMSPKNETIRLISGFEQVELSETLFIDNKGERNIELEKLYRLIEEAKEQRREMKNKIEKLLKALELLLYIKDYYKGE
jgi:hypothetical protein